MREIEFPSAVADARYRLTPREAYVLRFAPVRGLRGHGGRTMWMVGDEDLSKVVEGLLRRGFLALRGDAGPACADLTAAGGAAIDTNRPRAPR